VPNTVHHTDHVIARPEENIEMLRAEHLSNALRMLGNAMRGGPSIKDGPQTRSPSASKNEMATDIAGAPNLAEIDDPHDLPYDTTQPLVSLGQGDSQTDWPKYTPPRSATLPGIRALYDRCDELSNTVNTRCDVVKAAAPFEVRVSGRFEPAEPDTYVHPGHPAHFCVEGVHLPKDIHAQALANFVRLCADAGYSRAQIEPLLEIAHNSIARLSMDECEDAVERMTKQIEDDNPLWMQR
jgi:hypothetical protein